MTNEALQKLVETPAGEDIEKRIKDMEEENIFKYSIKSISQKWYNKNKIILKPSKWMQLIPELKDENWKKWWGFIKEIYKEHREETTMDTFAQLGISYSYATS